MTLTRNLEVVASDSENPGLITVGVVVDGAFVTLAAYKAGQHEQLKNVPAALELAAADKSGDAESEPAAA